jgi:glucose-6-phosphate isomerase
MQVLYEKPMKIDLDRSDLFVNGKNHPKNVRKLSKLKEVLKGYVDLDFTVDSEIYYMFRKVYEKNRIRFDITVISPKIIEGEFAKTYGHAHPEAEDGLSYPEVYQVLSGEAIFLLQKSNRDKSMDVKLIRTKKGDVLVIPPNFSHVTINPSKDVLVLSNLVADDFESDYAEFKKNRGAAFYYLEDGNVLQNANYVVRQLERPKIDLFNKKYGFESEDLLTEFHMDPKKFEFLKKPSLLFR